MFDFFRSKELLLRAWDDSMNTQPATITWNVMGMMNNCHFRVLIHPYTDAAGNMGVRFQHPAPVEVGALGNIGWREEDNLRQQALEAAGIAAAAGPLPPAAAAVPATNGVVAAKQQAAAVVAAAATNGHAANGGSGRLITMAEVEKHNTEDSAWFVYEGKVSGGVLEREGV